MKYKSINRGGKNKGQRKRLIDNDTKIKIDRERQRERERERERERKGER